jgi:predicted metalloprotease with PDZ domain
MLRFVDQFAGVANLSERVRALKVKDATGAALPLELRGGGLYLFSASKQPVTITYEMHLAQALDPSQQALVSGLGAEAAVLLPTDLLPRVCANEEDCEAAFPRARLRITAPDAWQTATTETLRGDYFELAEATRAVFFVGRLRERTTKLGALNLRVAIAGTWNFTDEQVFDAAATIAREQAAMIGGAEAGDFLVTLAPFPQPLTGLRSSAVTVGRCAVLLLNAGNNPAQTFAHYRRHLAHELFHFYLPNAFQVRENFDWFWEGFTRYVALLTLVRLRWLTLQDYLDALSAEYEAYAFNPLRAETSLIAASPEKFANVANYELVYRKGMLVAALYDLELRWQTGGKLSVVDVMRNLYRDHARRGRGIGNDEVLRELSRPGDFARLIRGDIEGTRAIDLLERVKAYGLMIERSSRPRGRLVFTSKSSARQRALFESLLLPPS